MATWIPTGEMSHRLLLKNSLNQSHPKFAIIAVQKITTTFRFLVVIVVRFVDYIYVVDLRKKDKYKPYWRGVKDFTPSLTTQIESEASKMFSKFGKHKAIEYAVSKVNCWEIEIVRLQRQLPCAVPHALGQLQYWRSVCDFIQNHDPRAA